MLSVAGYARNFDCAQPPLMWLQKIFSLEHEFSDFASFNDTKVHVHVYRYTCMKCVPGSYT